MAYPLDVFSKNKNKNKLKNDIMSILGILCEKLKNWEELKSICGIIEDFFKVGKNALNYGNSTSIRPNLYQTNNFTINIQFAIK